VYLIACNNNPNKINNLTYSRIFPLSPFFIEDEVVLSDSGNLLLKKKACIRVFILENYIYDTGYLKKQLLNFIDSTKEEKNFIQNYYKCSYWFYKTSSTLNKNYVEDPKRNSLGAHIYDYIATLEYKDGLLDWIVFYRKNKTILMSYKNGKYDSTYVYDNN
jgi:hypothetical protein